MSKSHHFPKSSHTFHFSTSNHTFHFSKSQCCCYLGDEDQCRHFRCCCYSGGENHRRHNQRRRNRLHCPQEEEHPWTFLVQFRQSYSVCVNDLTATIFLLVVVPCYTGRAPHHTVFLVIWLIVQYHTLTLHPWCVHVGNLWAVVDSCGRSDAFPDSEINFSCFGLLICFRCFILLFYFRQRRD